jgi:hypothetical protein
MILNRTLTLWLLGVLTWLFLLGSPTNAAPTAISTASDLLGYHSLADTSSLVSRAGKDPLPHSVQELKEKYYKSGPKKDKSCFFTGMDVGKAQDPRVNTADAKRQCKAAKLTTLDGIWKKNNIVNPGEWANKGRGEGDVFDAFIIWVLEMFAEETSGTSYLFIPESTKPRKESIFFANEFKAMKGGRKVDKIAQVKFEFGKSPSLPDASKDENLWWKRGAADPPTRDETALAPAPAPAAVLLQCFGTGNSRYINCEGIMKVIDTFCDEAAKQGTLDKDSGSIARTYNKDTPEQVDIAMDYRPGLNWRPMKDKCVE